MSSYFDDEEIDPSDYDNPDDDDDFGSSYYNWLENAGNKLAWFNLVKDGSKFLNAKYKEWQKKTNYTVQIDSEDELFPIAQNWVFSKMPPIRKRNLAATAKSLVGNPYASVDWQQFVDEDEEGFYEIDVEEMRAAFDGVERGISVFHDGHEKVKIEFGGQKIEVWFNRRQISNTLSNEEVTANVFAKKYVSLTLITKSLEVQQAILTTLNELFKESKKQKHTPVVRIVDKWNNWTNRSDLPVRNLESVILRDGQLESLIEDVQTFIDDEPRYNHLSVPYHRGYLLHGPPGTGKTTVAKALAHHFNYDLWYLPLGDIKSDIDLMALFSRVPAKSVLLLEDIDVFSMVKDRTDVGRAATLSGLLNCLDGVSTPHGLITFMTTNNIDVLDTAVKRAGRVDRQEFFGYADNDQINRLWNLYFPEAQPKRAFKTLKEFAPSEIIEVLKHHWNDPKAAEAELKKFLS